MNKTDIKNENIHNSTVTNNVTQILANFEEYNEWKSELDLAIQTLSSLSKDRADLHSKYEEKISFYRKNIENYEGQLKEALSDIKVDLDYQQDALNALGKLRPDLAISILLERTSYIKEIEQKVNLKFQEINQAKLNIANHYLLLALSRQADYTILNRFEDTCKYFQSSIESSSTKANVFGYAHFLKEHNEFPEAEKYYKLYLFTFENEIAENEYAAALNDLAIVYRSQTNYEDALREFMKALRIRRRLAKKDSHTYLPDVATTLNDLAVLHRNQNNYKKALKEYEEALRIRRRLAKKDSHTYLPDVATTLNNLAVLHRNQNNYEKALKEYEEALRIRRRLAKTDSYTYLPKVAATLNNLAVLHRDQKNYKDALREFIEALKIYRQLAETNSHTYLPKVAATLNNLAVLHRSVTKYGNALEEYLEALQIYQQLADTNLKTYLPDVAMTLINISIFYQLCMKDMDKSLNAALRAVQILLPIVKKVPYTRKYLKEAKSVLRDWGLNPEEIQHLVDEKIKISEGN